MALLFSKCFKFPIKHLNYVLSVVLVTFPIIPFFSNFGWSINTKVLYLPIYLDIDSLNNNVAIGCVNSFSNILIIAHKSWTDNV